MGYRLLHYTRALHHLRQEQLARAKQVAHHVHATHERPFDDLDGVRDGLPGLFGVAYHKRVDAVHEGMREPLLHRQRSPRCLLRGYAFRRASGRFGHVHDALGGIGTAVEHEIFYALPQIGGDVFVGHQCAGIHDAHIHAGLHAVVQEHRVDGFAQRVVAAETEAHVTHATADLGVRERGLDLLRGLEVAHRVPGVLLDARADGEDVGVEDDVLWREAHLLCEQLVRPRTDFDFALGSVRLPLFVERHHDHCGAVAPHETRLAQELRFALLEGDGVHDALALQALEPGLDDAPLAGVHHNGHARDVRLAGHQVEERGHRLLGVEQPLVHVDVDELRAVLHLLTRDGQRLGVVALENELRETRRARHIGALAHVHEVRGGAHGERFEPAEAKEWLRLRDGAWRHALHGLRDGGNVLGGGATAAAHDVQQPALCPFGDVLGHHLGRLVVAAEGVGEAGVGVGRNVAVGDAAELLHVAAQLGRAECAVEADGERLDVGHGGPERLGRLAGKGAP